MSCGQLKLGFLKVMNIFHKSNYPESPTRIYRDPFGNEFVISMDLNGNGNCTDQFYSSNADRAAAAGMVKNKAGEFGIKGREAIIWTSGPDKYTNPLASGAGEENNDNIMSWK